LARILIKRLLLSTHHSELPQLKYLSLEPKFSKYSIGKFSYGDSSRGECPPIIVGSEGKATIKIGKFCSVGAGVTILLNSDHRTDWITTYPFKRILQKKNYSAQSENTFSKGDVIIGNDVWIGIDSLILSGVRIGDGAVIGAHSVVTHDVEPYTVTAGNPARAVRKRFDQETIDKLIKIHWWDWEFQRVKENLPLLLSDNLKEFIEKNV
jgi:virginiamycin A acetyltransferase